MKPGALYKVSRKVDGYHPTICNIVNHTYRFKKYLKDDSLLTVLKVHEYDDNFYVILVEEETWLMHKDWFVCCTEATP